MTTPAVQSEIEKAAESFALEFRDAMRVAVPYALDPNFTEARAWMRKHIATALTHIADVAKRERDGEIREMIKVIAIDPKDEQSWSWQLGAARFKKNVLDLLNPLQASDETEV